MPYNRVTSTHRVIQEMGELMSSDHTATNARCTGVTWGAQLPGYDAFRLFGDPSNLDYGGGKVFASSIDRNLGAGSIAPDQLTGGTVTTYAKDRWWHPSAYWIETPPPPPTFLASATRGNHGDGFLVEVG
jgi:hypothetical protein